MRLKVTRFPTRADSHVRIQGKLLWRRSLHPAAHSPFAMAAPPSKIFPKLARVSLLLGYNAIVNRFRTGGLGKCFSGAEDGKISNLLGQR